MKKVLITGLNGSLSRAVAKWIENKNEYVVQQISLRGDNWRNVSFSDVYCIIHIAGITPQNAKSEEDYEQINSVLTQKLAQKAENDGVCRFIYISSMAVYGLEQQMEIEAGTVTEKTPCNPTTAYGRSKLQAEQNLMLLNSDKFRVTAIRVPSIYGKGKTEYLDQYKYLAEKLPVIPIAFPHHYKSAIYVDNLCELIYLSMGSNSLKIICPDDGGISAVDFCRAIYPNKRCSRLLGMGMEALLKSNDRIRDYYGAISYSRELAEVFEGKYRVIPFAEAVRRTYD